MSATLQLNCLVSGLASSNVFQVEIEKTKTVAALKDAIKDKKKPKLDHIAADSLDLWAVSIPYRELAQKLSNFDFVDEQRLSCWST
jgi:hypothetical protein